MLSVFEDFKGRIQTVLQELQADNQLPGDLDLTRITVELPRDPSHGDLATNAALVLAKPAKRNPREIAELIVGRIKADEDLTSASVAGPGFINLTLSHSFWQNHLSEILSAGRQFASPDLGQNEPLNVEYVSANPTGPMHVGHCRGAVVGDALASLLEYAGYKVTREYYINDAGSQVDVLARSAFLRYLEALGEEVSIPEGLYPGEYLKSIGSSLAASHGNALQTMGESDWLPTVRTAAIDGMIALIQADLKILGIDFDVFFSERSMSTGEVDAVDLAIQTLKDLDLVYMGRLDPPKGELPDDWEDREQLLFRSTQFGDDVDRALLKSDGSYTYFAGDIAYHFDKYRRGFSSMIDIWGADHGGYVKRMKAAVTAITGGKGTLDIELCQIVRLFRDGEPVKMSKRSGDFITLRDVVEEVGRDPVRFMMLYRKSDAPLDFDFAKVTDQSKDNPVFYVQYAHARCHSAFRQAKAAFPDLTLPVKANADLSSLDDPVEIAVIKTLATFPQIVRAAAANREPHRIAFYLYDLASSFHALWNRGKDVPQLRFINLQNRQSTQARMALIEAVVLVLGTGLDILGVNAPEAM